MNPTLQIILESIVLIAVLLLMGFLKLKETTELDIVRLIAEAEKLNKPGAEKMQWLVSTVYDAMVPIAKAYFTRDRIQKLAQTIFDYIRKYADKYHNNKI